MTFDPYDHWATSGNANRCKHCGGTWYDSEGPCCIQCVSCDAVTQDDSDWFGGLCPVCQSIEECEQ